MSSLERLAPTQETRPVPVESPLRGRRYGVDRLYLLPRDPRSVFAAWELSPTLHARAVEIARVRRSEIRYVLRIERRDRDGSGAIALATLDIPDAVSGEGWYVPLDRSGGECRAVLGLALGGAFEPVLHSRWVPVPPDGSCAEEGPWDLDREAREWLLRRFAQARPGSAGASPGSPTRYLAPSRAVEPRT